MQRLRGHEVLTLLGAAAVVGLVLAVVPMLDRVALLLASAGLLVGVGALGIWLIRDHHDIEWTSAGTVARARGSDRRVTALARTIDTSLTGDGAAGRAVQATLRSLADARLAAHGLSLEGPDAQAEGALGAELTAYLVSPTPRHLTADELSAFITTLEEHE